MKKIVKLFKQIICNHEWCQYKMKPAGGFVCISGERIYIACKKCEKIKGSFFSRHVD